MSLSILSALASTADSILSIRSCACLSCSVQSWPVEAIFPFKVWSNFSNFWVETLRASWSTSSLLTSASLFSIALIESFAAACSAFASSIAASLDALRSSLDA